MRTGLGGEKVVINGGAFVLPIIHETTPVNMNVVQLDEVVRDKENALITKDRMRVDMVAEFYVRVAPTREAVSMAAATVGRRTMEQVPPARAAVGQVHRRAALGGGGDDARGDARAARRLRHQGKGGGLRGARDERSRARVGRDYRARPDGPGVLQPLQPVRRGRSHPPHRGDRDPPQDAQRHRAGRDGAGFAPATSKPRSRRSEIDRESETARLEQERDIEVRRAAQRADLARERAQRETEAEQAEILAREETEKARISNEEALERGPHRGRADHPPARHRSHAHPSRRRRSARGRRSRRRGSRRSAP